MKIPQTGTNVQFIVVYGKPGCYKGLYTLGCFQNAWNSRQTLQWKHDATLMVQGSNWWYRWNAFFPGPLLTQRRKLKRITQYGCILFACWNKPLIFHTGDSLDLNNPPSQKYICVASLFLSEKSKLNKMRQSVLWYQKKEHTCIWQLWILDQSWLQSFNTVLTQQRRTSGTNMTHHHKPQFYGYYSQFEWFLAMKISKK